MTEPLSNIALDATRPVAVLERAALAQAVAIATLAVDRKNTIPILSNLLLTGDGGSLTVTGTDLDLVIKVRVPGAADERLAVTLPAHKLKDILTKAKASELASIDQRETVAGVDMGGVRFALQSIPASDFPDLRGPADTAASFSLPTCLLELAIDRTRFAISTEETRYYLNGLHLHPRRQSPGAPVTLRVVATDGHRLAMFDMTKPVCGKSWSRGLRGKHAVIIPTRALDTFGKIVAVLRRAKVLPESVAVSVDRRVCRIVIGAVEITTKLIDGTFPDYQRVVPRHNDKNMTIGVKALAEGVEQVSLISSEKGRAVKFTLADGNCRLTVNNPDAGAAEMDIACAYVSDELVAGYNPAYVRDILAELSGDDAVWSFADAGSPVVVTDPADARFSAVLMPMRV